MQQVLDELARQRPTTAVTHDDRGVVAQRHRTRPRLDVGVDLLSRPLAVHVVAGDVSIRRNW